MCTRAEHDDLKMSISKRLREEESKPGAATSTEIKRSINFMEIEVELLVDLVSKHKDVLEKKNPDAVTPYTNKSAWEMICLDFNIKGLNIYRSEKCLKLKYEKLKRSIKNKLREIKSKPCATAVGGPAVPRESGSKLTALEERIRLLNPPYFDGSIIRSHKDVLMQANGITPSSRDDHHVGSDEMVDDDLEKIADVAVGGTEYSPSVLRTTVPKELASTSVHNKHSSSDTQSPSTYDDSKSSSSKESERTVGKSSGNKRSYANTITNTNGSNAKKQAGLVNTAKDWSDVAKMEMDVLHLKKQILEEELDFKRKKHDLKLQILNSELLSQKKLY